MRTETSFGTVTDYTTGTTLRPATAEEWRRTADRLSNPGDGYTGAWKDGDDRAVYVDGGPESAVHPSDINALRDEAQAAGDYEMAGICERAMDGDDTDNPEWDRCREVILDTRMRSAEDGN